MSKPWDTLREPVKTPLGTGKWLAPGYGTKVAIEEIDTTQGCESVRLGIHGAWFKPSDLRLIAEFCTELADQLEAGE